MTALALIEKNYLGTEIEAVSTVGIANVKGINALDCNCVSGDCSTGGYEY